MTQEEKDLLLKDLCARLPYGVKVQIDLQSDIYPQITCKVCSIEYAESGSAFIGVETSPDTYNEFREFLCKPYLFPLSSMTNELWDKEFRGYGITEYTRDSFKYDCEILDFNDSNIDLSNMVGFINQLIKHHFDVYELIPLGLAIDATGLNIY